MSANAPAAPAKEKPKSKKMMIIIIVVVALLVVAGGAAAWLLSSRSHPKDEEVEEPVAAKESAKTPPTFLPIENMVVNLADPGENGLRRLVSPWKWLMPKLRIWSSNTCPLFAAAS